MQCDEKSTDNYVQNNDTEYQPKSGVVANTSCNQESIETNNISDVDRNGICEFKLF